MQVHPPPGKRHGHHDDGHGHASEDSVRQHALASLYWYVLGIVLILGFVARLLSAWIARQQIKRKSTSSTSALSESTLQRALEGSRSAFTASFLYRRRPSWLVAIPWKKAFAIIVYALFVTFLLTWKAIKHDATFEERLGFRAAWITTTQASLPFLLAARFNPIGLVLGTSPERLNWFHRWAARVFAASATVHGAVFVTEWIAADFFWTELETVSMVKPGFGAWAVLMWTVGSSWLPVRRWRYEFFVVQHILAAVALLVFLLLHVPAHHRFSIWCAVAVFAYDVLTRSLHAAWRNIRIRTPTSSFDRVPRYAFRANAEAPDSELTVLTIRDVAFNWMPGQHLLLWTPTFPKQSTHPFTICNIPDPSLSTQNVQLTVKTKSGFTKELNHWARQSHQLGHDCSLRLLIQGPFGSLPNWRQFDSLILVASATGGSFTTPVLEDLISTPSPGCLRKINALYIARRKAHVEPYLQQISKALARCKELGISVRIQVAITQAATALEDAIDESRVRLIDQQDEAKPETAHNLELSRLSLDSMVSSNSARSEQLLKEEMDLSLNDHVSYDTSFVDESVGRPDVEGYVKSSVRVVPGDVAVAVCAGSVIEQKVQRAVAALRHERAAQAMDSRRIMLHIERAAS